MGATLSIGVGAGESVAGAGVGDVASVDGVGESHHWSAPQTELGKRLVRWLKDFLGGLVLP